MLKILNQIEITSLGSFRLPDGIKVEFLDKVMSWNRGNQYWFCSLWRGVAVSTVLITLWACGNGMLVALEPSEDDYCRMPSHSSKLSSVSEEDATEDTTQIRAKADQLLAQNRFQEALWLYQRDPESQTQAAQLKNKIHSMMIHSPYTVVKKNIGGTTENYLLDFDAGFSGLAKPVGNWDMDPDAEVGAARVSSLFGFNFVPETVMRTVEGKKCSIQYFVKGMTNGSEANFNKKNFRKLLVFDFLVFNQDRNTSNFLFWPSENLVIAIDHGRAFKTRCGISNEVKGHLAIEKKLSARIHSISKEEVYSALSDLRDDIADRVWDQVQLLRSP